MHMCFGARCYARSIVSVTWGGGGVGRIVGQINRSLGMVLVGQWSGVVFHLGPKNSLVKTGGRGTPT